MKTPTPIVIFYILYFFWLFTVTYLAPEISFLNYFTIGVAVFYFIFLREKGDLIWFWIAALIPLAFSSFSVPNGKPDIDLSLVTYMPIWLPLAWGTTVVALRKFYIVVTSL